MVPPKTSLAAALLLALTSTLAAQCDPLWTPRFTGAGVDGGVVQASAVWDDGSGPALYAIGSFSSAGATMAAGIAKWDGARWTALGEGLTGGAAGVGWEAAAGVPGPGPASGLYIAADFQFAGGVPATPIVRWDGQAWSAIPGSLPVSGRAMIGFDPDGPGPQSAILYAGPRTWDGQSWSATAPADVWRYRALDLGAGPTLYAAGALGSAARLDHGAWVPAGPALDGVIDLVALDADGPGPAPVRLCALTNTGLVYALDANQWTAIAASAGAAPYTLAAFDPDGPGPELPTLYVALDSAIVRLVGAEWIAVSSFSHPNCSCAPIYELIPFDPSGPEPESLYATGYFRYTNGQVTNGVCKWSGDAFAPITPNLGLDSTAGVMLVMDEDGPGPARPALFVGGLFGLAGSVSAPGIARWDGRDWSSVGGGVAASSYYQVAAMTAWDPDGDGPAPASLVIGGRFTSVGGAGGTTANGLARWDGQAWHNVGSGTGQYVFGINALASFDEDGPGGAPAALFAAGWFNHAAGVPAQGIARWNGADWSAVGSPPWSSTYIRALAVFDQDGPGPARPSLFVGADSADGLYRWDGQSWSIVGGGLVGAAGNLVTALAVVDEDGPGPLLAALYIGGAFDRAGGTGGILATSIARWDGQHFSAMGAGLGEYPVPVDAIAAIDWTRGAGAPTLYAGGPSFDLSVRGLAMWHAPSQQWLPVGTGAENIRALAAFDDGGAAAGPALYAAGAFREAGAVPAASIARFGCPAPPAGGCYPNCDGSTLLPLLNVADLICFLQRFASADPYANCDGSSTPPVLNVADFVCFQQRFAAGCP